MFKPRYKKRGHLLLKGVKKFLHYKRDIISDAKMEEIDALQDEFKQALAEDDAERVKKLTPKLTQVCEKSVPRQSFPGLRENIEVIFVAVVIAVGIRAYFLQPFKIPTGSMQVTLNGVLPFPGEGEQPGFFTRAWEKVWRGRSYMKVESPHTGRVATLPNGEVDLEETNFLLFSRTTLRFEDGYTMTFSVPKDRIATMGLDDALRKRGGLIEKGDILVEGYTESGDQVLVDKVSYHFRDPSRGEVFVFNTRGIEMIENSGRMQAEWGSQHYIKRLVGIPDDTLEVKPPMLFINGQEAQEPGIRRVWEEAPPYRGYSEPGGYRDRSSRVVSPIMRIELKPDGEFERSDGRIGKNAEQWEVIGGDEIYWAMGDNSYASSDSRSWGPVPERNVVGPALFVYWPFAQHWGFIR